MKYYNYCMFSKEGIFKGFVIGISFKEFVKEFKQLSKEYIIIPCSTSQIPNKFLEGFYYKISQDKKDLELMLKQF